MIFSLSSAPTITSSPRVVLNRARLILAARSVPASASLLKSVVIFESIGGSDKGSDGLRRDTHALLSAFKRLGWSARVVKYHDGVNDARLIDKVAASADAFVSRIDPGEWVNFSPTRYHIVLESLLERGLEGFPKPKEMTEFGSKLTLVKLLDLPFSASDTHVYRTREEFFKRFPVSLLLKKTSANSRQVRYANAPLKRVLKRSGGAMGAGVWMVSAAGITTRALQNTSTSTSEPGAVLSLLQSLAASSGRTVEDVLIAKLDPVDITIHANEAARNRKLTTNLRTFLNMASDAYLTDEQSDFILDMRFLPRVADGELRLIFLGDKPVRLVTRVPAPGCFSAGLDSGAVHRAQDNPEKGVFGEYVRSFQGQMGAMKERLEMDEWPLLWTADFILDDENEQFGMTLSEINANCIGFAAHRDFADVLAAEALRRIIEHRRQR